MLKSIEGIYRDGKVVLAEKPADVRDETPVIVTFLDPHGVDLRAQGIEAAQADELRGALAAFTEDWNRPEMAAYDDYDAARRAS